MGVRKSGGQPGNKSAVKGKIVSDRLRLSVAINDYAAVRKITDKVVRMATDGDRWAIEFVRDTLDGKPKHQVELSSDPDAPVSITVVAAEALRAKLRNE